MLTEGHNGICPKCGYRKMMTRCGSGGYLQYDACTKCGFLFSEFFEWDESKKLWELKSARDELWKEILKACNRKTREELHEWIDSLKEDEEPLPSVFKYDTCPHCKGCAVLGYEDMECLDCGKKTKTKNHQVKGWKGRNEVERVTVGVDKEAT